MFRLAPGVLRGYAQVEASSGWFRGLGCFLRLSGSAVWRVLIAVWVATGRRRSMPTLVGLV